MLDVLKDCEVDCSMAVSSPKSHALKHSFSLHTDEGSWRPPPPPHPVQMLQALHCKPRPTEILALQPGGGGRLCVEECEPSGVPEHHAEAVAQMVRVHQLAQRAWYNRSNSQAILAVAVKVQRAILDSREARDDLRLAGRLLARVWEMGFFISLFSYSGWLERLVHGPVAPDDTVTFESMRAAFLQLLPGFKADPPQEPATDWDDSSAHLLARVSGSGGMQALYCIRMERSLDSSKSYAAADLPCPPGADQADWEMELDLEIDCWAASKEMGAHLQIRHASMRVMWHRLLKREEVPWSHFWDALPSICEPSDLVKRVASSLEARNVVQRRINRVGSPASVTALEVDMVFPPLVPVAETLASVLALGGWQPDLQQQDGDPLLSIHKDPPQASPALMVSCGILRANSQRSGMLCIAGGPGAGKQRLASMLSAEMLRSSSWDSFYKADLRSASTASEAADMLAGAVCADPYCLASNGARPSSHARLASWAKCRAAHAFEGESDGDKVPDGSSHKCIGLLVSHVTLQLLEDEIESEAVLDLLSALLEGVSKSSREGGGKVHMHIVITSQQEVPLGCSQSWFAEVQRLAPDREAGRELLREGTKAVPSGGGEAAVMAEAMKQEGLAEMLGFNPLALRIVGSACRFGVTSLSEAQQVLSRRIPPAVVMGRKTALPPGVTPPPGSAAARPLPAGKADDPMRAVRAGRKCLADTKVLLQSPLARVMISLKSCMPEQLQTALVLLAYLPSYFDLQLATRILAPILPERHSTFPAATLYSLTTIGLIQFNSATGVFCMQASVQNVVRGLMMYSDPSADLSILCEKAISCILDTAGAALTQASVMVDHGAPLAGFFILNHHLPLFWKVQYWAQERELDKASHQWLLAYLKPMAEHPAVFTHHLPASSRACLCRTMAAAAGYLSSHTGRAVVLWHLGQALLQEGQPQGAYEVLERGIEALDNLRSTDNPDRARWAETTPAMAVQLLEAQLCCSRAVCAARMNNIGQCQDMMARAEGLQAKALAACPDLARHCQEAAAGASPSGPGELCCFPPSSSTDDPQQAPASVPLPADSLAVEGSVRVQLASTFLLKGSMEMTLGEYKTATAAFQKATSLVGGSGSSDSTSLELQTVALAEHRLSRVAGLQGDWGGSLKHLISSTELWQRAGTPGANAAAAWIDAAELLAASGAVCPAQEAANAAAALAADRGDTAEALPRLLNILAKARRSSSTGGEEEGPSPAGDEEKQAGFLKRLLRRSSSNRQRSSASSGDGPQAFASPAHVLERWRDGSDAEGPALGMSGIRGWPLEIWYGSPTAREDLTTSPLLTRYTTLTHEWVAYMHQVAREKLGPPATRGARMSRSRSRGMEGDAQQGDPTTKANSNRQDSGAATSGLPAGEPGSGAPAGGPPEPAPVRRMRRPAGRSASGSLAHAAAPHGLEQQLADIIGPGRSERGMRSKPRQSLGLLDRGDPGFAIREDEELF